MLGFQPAAGSFELAPGETPRLLYQQFALLHLLLFRDENEAAIAQVQRRPHRAWMTSTEQRPAGRPLPGTSRLAQSLTRPGPRQLWPTGRTRATLPLRIDVDVSTETLDTPANRFIKFALERWRDIALLAAEAVETTLRGGPQRRGRVEIARTLARLDELLASPVFDDVGRMTTFPAGNPVLTRAEGYRQLFGMFLAIEAGVELPTVVEDPFLISQRNIATLYETWCFLQLVSAVGAACGVDRRHEIFRRESGTMGLALPQGEASKLTWKVLRRGRTLDVELFFNRSFGEAESWTQRMRPDCSLLIRPRSGSPYESEALDIWLHFDAKYKVENFARQFSVAMSEAEAAEAEVEEDLGSHRRVDLLKMHAYRDAIQRSAGAFVLFPGAKQAQFRVAGGEVLPGLGAFPLTPANVPRGDTGPAALRRDSARPCRRSGDATRARSLLGRGGVHGERLDVGAGCGSVLA